MRKNIILSEISLHADSTSKECRNTNVVVDPSLLLKKDAPKLEFTNDEGIKTVWYGVKESDKNHVVCAECGGSDWRISSTGKGRNSDSMMYRCSCGNMIYRNTTYGEMSSEKEEK